MPTTQGTDRQVLLLKKLLPPGKLFEKIGDLFSSILRPFAEEIDRFRERIEDVKKEANPATSTELLPDYEEIALAPDERPDPGADIAERRGIVSAKLNTAFVGPTEAFFIEYARKLGITITSIETNVPVYFDCSMDCSEALILRGSVYIWRINYTGGTDSARLHMKQAFRHYQRRHTLLGFNPRIGDEDALDAYNLV